MKLWYQTATSDEKRKFYPIIGTTSLISGFLGLHISSIHVKYAEYDGGLSAVRDFIFGLAMLGAAAFFYYKTIQHHRIHKEELIKQELQREIASSSTNLEDLAQ